MLSKLQATAYQVSSLKSSHIATGDCPSNADLVKIRGRCVSKLLTLLEQLCKVCIALQTKLYVIHERLGGWCVTRFSSSADIFICALMAGWRTIHCNYR